MNAPVFTPDSENKEESLSSLMARAVSDHWHRFESDNREEIDCAPALLTRAERDYLIGRKKVSKKYASEMQSRIKKKLDMFFDVELPLLMTDAKLGEYVRKSLERDSIPRPLPIRR